MYAPWSKGDPYQNTRAAIGGDKSFSLGDAFGLSGIPWLAASVVGEPSTYLAPGGAELGTAARTAWSLKKVSKLYPEVAERLQRLGLRKYLQDISFASPSGPVGIKTLNMADLRKLHGGQNVYKLQEVGGGIQKRTGLHGFTGGDMIASVPGTQGLKTIPHELFHWVARQFGRAGLGGKLADEFDKTVSSPAGKRFSDFLVEKGYRNAPSHLGNEIAARMTGHGKILNYPFIRQVQQEAIERAPMYLKDAQQLPIIGPLIETALNTLNIPSEIIKHGPTREGGWTRLPSILDPESTDFIGADRGTWTKLPPLLNPTSRDFVGLLGD